VVPLAVLLAMLAGCGRYSGAAHIDLLIQASNRARSGVTIRWSGENERGSFRVAPCSVGDHGFLYGDYTISIGDTPVTTFEVHATSRSEPEERWILIKPDGSVDTNASPQPLAASPC
jgi:hypothetical protein